jgi:hypothetical protein
VAGLVLAGCAVGVLTVGAAFPCLTVRAGLKRPLLRKLVGWRELAAKTREREEAWQGPPRFLVAESFSGALCVAFHLDRREGIYCLPHERNRRYGMEEDLRDWGIDWRTMVREQTGRPALFIDQIHWSAQDGRDRLPAILPAFFPDATIEDSAVLTCDDTSIGYADLVNCPALRPAPRVLRWLEGRSAGAFEDYQADDDDGGGRQPDAHPAFAVDGKGGDDA